MGRWHADAVQRIGGTVTLIVDPNDAAREALGRRHPSAQLARDMDVGVVARAATAAHLCTPLPTHTPLMMALLAGGVPLLVEKPFTENMETTQRVLALSRARGLVVCPVHQFLFQPGVVQLLAWLPELGALRRIEFSTCSAGATGSDAASLDSLIGEILPHPLSLVSALLRRPIADAAWHVAYPSPGEFRAMTTLDATVVDVAISAHGRPTENVIRAVGDDGSVVVDLFHGYAVRHSSRVSRRAKITQPFVAAARTFGIASVNLARRVADREPAYPGLRPLVRAFYDAVRGDAPAPITPDAIAGVALTRDRLLSQLR
jgi:predicted dehydrogenase